MVFYFRSFRKFSTRAYFPFPEVALPAFCDQKSFPEVLLCPLEIHVHVFVDLPLSAGAGCPEKSPEWDGEVKNSTGEAQVPCESFYLIVCFLHCWKFGVMEIRSRSQTCVVIEFPSVLGRRPGETLRRGITGRS